MCWPSSCRGGQLRTDAAGRVAAELVPGSYAVFDGSNPFAALFGNDLGARLTWDAGGPAPSELLLKRAQGQGLPAFPPGDG